MAIQNNTDTPANGVITEWQLPGDNSVIRILETELGPMISHSRVSVYDIMEAYDEGFPEWEINKIYNLSPHQIKVALAYVAEYRAQLEEELKEILLHKAERERYYRALEAEIRQQRSVELTPRRVALKKLIQDSRERWGIPDADQIWLHRANVADPAAMEIVDSHRLPRQQQIRLRELLFKNREGSLTETEEQELDSYMAKMDQALEDAADDLLRLAENRKQILPNSP